ncbi:MAG: hypothetical protein LUQ47_03440 [Methanotrichaceae archaeon]|nr:hypothetical protein [Methanotrichaceae archaeon]
MRVYFMVLAAIILTLLLAYAQGNQDLSNLNATNQNATSQNPTGLAANLIGLESLISKPVYDIESFTTKKPLYDTSMLSRTIKPVFDVSQREFLPARFSYTMTVMRPTFNISQRGGQLTARFIYNAGITKPIYDVSAYSAMKPFYEIGQFYRISPFTPFPDMKPNSN